VCSAGKRFNKMVRDRPDRSWGPRLLADRRRRRDQMEGRLRQEARL